MDDIRDGTQSVDRAIALLQQVGRAGQSGIRLVDLTSHSGLPKPTVRRLLIALIRGGLIEQDSLTRRYHVGPETHVLGVSASKRFGLHALSLGALSRIALDTGDSAFVSVRRDSFAVCLHCEEGAFPIRTQVLKPGDRHPLGVGAGSLAMLASLSDAEVEQVISDNGDVLSGKYPAYSREALWDSVKDTRERGYAFNPGMLMAGSWGIGLPVRDPHHEVVGALSIAAIESRLQEARHAQLVELLRAEVRLLEAELRKPAPKTHDARDPDAQKVRANATFLTNSRSRRTAP